MSRAFDGTGDVLTFAGAVLTAVPITMACWFNATNTDDETLMSLDDNGGDDGFALYKSTTLAAGVTDAGGFNDATSGAISTGTWQHAAAVFASNSSRSAYLDGSAGSDGNSRTPGTVTHTRIGRDSNSILSAQVDFTGEIAEAAIWNVALSSAEIAQLADGVSPLLVRPESLVAYWPLIGNDSPETDRLGAFPLTVTSATKGTSHPRIFTPSGPS